MHTKLQYTLAGLGLTTVAILIAGGAIYRVEDIKAKTADARRADMAKTAALDAEMHRQEHIASEAASHAQELIQAQTQTAYEQTPAGQELKRLEAEDRAALAQPRRAECTNFVQLTNGERHCLSPTPLPTSARQPPLMGWP
jgi:hypothetical protein